jgi:2-methylisocitrate lyase-like PEP mutase family enzyme
MPFQEATAHFQELIHRQGQVLTVMHPPSVALARVMESAGVEAGFVGTSGVVGSYTGMGDTGIASIPECVTVGGWIARAVKFPVMLDGDTGHGGIMAVRRLVQDCIHAGLAGVRIDDQDIEGKRGTGSAGVVVAPLDVALARYRAAVDCKRELDPNFVIMAQCYTGEASNGGFDEALRRMQLYKEVGEVDWVQFTAPRSIEQARQARAVVDGPFSIMEGFLPEPITHQQLLDIGITIQWMTLTHLITWVALHDFISDFMQRGPAATQDFLKQHQDNPYVNHKLEVRDRQDVQKQRELEEKYFGAQAQERYARAPGRNAHGY